MRPELDQRREDVREEVGPEVLFVRQQAALADFGEDLSDGFEQLEGHLAAREGTALQVFRGLLQHVRRVRDGLFEVRREVRLRDGARDLVQLVSQNHVAFSSQRAEHQHLEVLDLVRAHLFWLSDRYSRR